MSHKIKYEVGESGNKDTNHENTIVMLAGDNHSDIPVPQTE